MHYCLAVARDLGATEEELEETMAIAMTVGATKIQVLQKGALASMRGSESSETHTEEKEEQPGEQEACSA